MKNRRLCFLSLAAAALLMASCSQEELAENRNMGDGLAKATTTSFTAFGDDTRSVVDPTTSPIAFKWADGDQLAIYSGGEASGMSNFDLVDGIDSEVATFKANGFSLMSGAEYYAFTPYDGDQTDKTKIGFDYNGQVQVQNNSYSHLGAKDFQYSTATTASSGFADDLTDFTLSHLGAVCRFQLTVPEAGVFTEFTLSGTGLASKGNFDITSATTTYGEPDGSITLSLVTSSSSGISVAANGVLTLYMMLPQQNLSGKSLTATLTTTESKTYSATLTGKNIEGGHAYGWTADVKVPLPPHDYVDLGLPSGTLWATCNVGAEKPEDYGLYFAWGETTGYGPGTADGKDGTTTDGRKFDWASYKWMDHSKNSWSGCLKYTFADNQTSGCWYSGSTYVGTTVDGKTYTTLTQLESADDAATANWGSDWCMPTHAQQQELVNSSYTTTEWTTLNGVYGRKITSKVSGYTDNYIFLPAAGYRYDSSLDGAGSSGYYWSSELGSNYSDYAWQIAFISSYVKASVGTNRSNGQSVRAVRCSASK